MKSEVNSPVEDKKEIEYPCLMQCDNIVVLFTSQDKGTVVNVLPGEFNYLVGYISDVWDMDGFIPFAGSITLSND